MMNWNKLWCIPVALILSGIVTPVCSQSVADTIQITITGTLTDVAITGEYVTPFRVGDSVIFTAQAVDEDGDPINAMFTFFTEDSTALRLEAMPDGSALGIALRKATVRVWVVAEPITQIQIASFRPPDSLNWTGYDTIPIGSTLQYCAWATRNGSLVAESPGPPACPVVFLPDEPGPGTFYAMFKVDRRVGRTAFNTLARGMRVYRGEG